MTELANTFRGHKFVKLVTDEWVLDTDTEKIYRVELDNNGLVKNYVLAYLVRSGEKMIEMPARIIREAFEVMKDAERDKRVQQI